MKIVVLAFDIIDKWMTTEFEGGKHERRILSESEIRRSER